MKQADQLQHSSLFRRISLRTWLLGSIVTVSLLMVLVMLIVPRVIDLASIKEKLQTTFTEQTGGRLDYQEISLSYLPRPAVELHQVSLALPNQVAGTIGSLRIAPSLLPLLAGEVRLARVDLDALQINLQLPDTKKRETPAQPAPVAELMQSLTEAIKPLDRVISSLTVQITNGGIVASRNKKKLVEIEGLDLKMDVTVNGSDAVLASLQARLANLNLSVSGRQEAVKNLSLSGSTRIGRDRISANLNSLVLADPALALTGNLILAKTSPAISLNLSGTNINVDATRAAALSLAGNITPVREIFDYLRGGLVPRISFTTHGENWSDLGDLNNILIKGMLQEGKISIPEIKLDLTGVVGEVVISGGVLTGSRLSAKLLKSTGRDGSLQIGLAEDNDLFTLELLLNADLAETKSILLRVVDDQAFNAELKKITNLKGTGQGKLTLGNSLNDIGTKVEISNLKLSGNYQRVPLPINITHGQFAFAKKQVDISQLGGSVGKSLFSDLSCLFLWEKRPFLNIGSGRFELDMTELYPWIASFKGVRDSLQNIKKVAGRLDLSDFNLQGPVGKPSQWKYGGTGRVKGLSLQTDVFPNTIKLASGTFKVKTRQLSFTKLQATSRDGSILLSGSLQGFPQRLKQLDLSLDGHLGARSLAWFSDHFKLPKAYAIRAPLNIPHARISWQPDVAAAVKALVSIDKGPAITVDIDHRPGQLQIHQLNIKDTYSDVSMVFDIKKAKRNFKFTGSLQHETMQAIFIDPRIRSGSLIGDVDITIPHNAASQVTTRGQLTGENLPVLLSSGDIMNIERIFLQANGPEVLVDIPKLTWKNLIWEPIQGVVSFTRNSAYVRLAEAKLCGIKSLGLFSFDGDQFSLDLTLMGKDLDVATSYTCLTEGRVKATGSLDFKSKITARGKMEELVKSLKGPLDMTLSKGVIEQDKLVARTLEVLNVTEIVKGRLPDLGSNGFPYNTATLQGEFQNGTLKVDKFYMDGETLDLVGTGTIDLEKENIDAQLLAAPFKTVDTVVKYLPGINYLLGGSLVTIPVSVTGPLDDPQVEILSASAVGSSLYKLAERTITSPFKLIEKIFPWGKNSKGAKPAEREQIK